MFPKSLYRTSHPKIISYSPDGKGRDNYIGFNSGGLKSSLGYSSYRSSPTFKVGAFRNPSPTKNLAPFKYNSDGSGRDFYIAFNSGGMH
mmetsp:Transcript_22456/g.3712  ORF Transcript_22456/g.3712 Transcript_22456/m.3712 type:complete len:89 (+) Transcript_22456:41-307(+)